MFIFSSRRRHTRCSRDWSSDVCSSDLIALAAQTVRRVVARFPGKVAVWHSDLSLGERFDTWQRVRAGELPVVVGARSALFAPVPNLGLIVVDEEHEPAY